MDKLTIGNCDITIGQSASRNMVLMKIWEHSLVYCEQTITPMPPERARRLADLLLKYAQQVEEQQKALSSLSSAD